jgi:hypothetical protein
MHVTLVERFPASAIARDARRLREQQRAQFFGRCIVSRMIGEQCNCGNF